MAQHHAALAAHNYSLSMAEHGGAVGSDTRGTKAIEKGQGEGVRNAGHARGRVVEVLHASATHALHVHEVAVGALYKALKLVLSGLLVLGGVQEITDRL